MNHLSDNQEHSFSRDDWHMHMFASHLDDADADVYHQEQEGVVPQAPPTTIMIPSELSASPNNSCYVPPIDELVLPTQVTPVPKGVAAMEPSPTLFTNYECSWYLLPLRLHPTTWIRITL